MYVLAIEGNENNGAYSVTDADGEQVLYLFEEEDDAVRYVMMLEDLEYPSMRVVEGDEDGLIKACEVSSTRYTIITPNDIVVPPK